MFKRITQSSNTQTSDWINITIDGEAVEVPVGETVATALLLSQQIHLRNSAITGTPRAPYCLMGVCFECLVRIDGVDNRQACMVQVEDGMIVERQL